GLLTCAKDCGLCRSGFDHRQNVFDLFGNKIADLEGGLNKPALTHMGEKEQQRLPESGNICDHHRLRMAVKLNPGQLLGQLFQRPDPAGEGDKSVCTLEHQTLALMHVSDNNTLLDVRQEPLSANQK